MTSLIEPAMLRASVLAGRRQLDLALPADVPIAALIPELTALLAPADDGPAGTWTLSPLGGPSYPPARTLTDAGARDGDLLLLLRELPRQAAPVFDDVAEGVALLTQESRRAWSAATAARLGRLIAAAAAAVTALCAVAALAAPADSRSPAAALVGTLTLALIAAAGWAARRGAADVARAAATCAYVLAAGTGALITGPGSAALTLTIAAATAAGAAIVTHRITGTDDAAHAAGITLALLFVCVGGTAATWQAPAPAIAALTALIGLATVFAAPRLAIAAAALPLPPVPSESSGDRRGPDDGPDGDNAHAEHAHTDEANERHDAHDGDSPVDSIARVELPGLPLLVRRTAVAGDLLTGIVAGGAAVTGAAAATIALTAPFGWRTGALVLALLLALVARGRTHHDVRQATALIGVAALAALTVVAVMTLRGSWPPVTGAALAAGLGATAAIAGALLPRHDFSPLQRRIGELTDYLLLAAIVPLALWIMGVYQLVRAH